MSWYKNILIEANKGNVVINSLFGLIDKLKGQASMVDELKKYHNLYKGKRCFVVGCGPSLNKTDLRKLKNEYSFGANRIYLKKNFIPSFLVSVNDLVLAQCAREIAKQDMPKFVSLNAKKYFENIKVKNKLFFLKQLFQAKFSSDITDGVWPGGTVTFVSLQLAYYMGFSEVILIGVDHNFVAKGENNKEIETLGDDLNHFSKDYFRGFRWNLPDLATSEYSYRLAKKSFEGDKRRIVDATVDGKLKVFKKVDYKSLFK